MGASEQIVPTMSPQGQPGLPSLQPADGLTPSSVSVAVPREVRDPRLLLALTAVPGFPAWPLPIHVR